MSLSATELRSMTYPQLLKLETSLKSVILEKKAEIKPKVKQELARFVEEKGFSLEDFIRSAHKGSNAKKVLSAKYRDPNDPQHTWSGRGRRPNWYKEETALRVG